MKGATPQQLADIIDAIEKIQSHTPSDEAALAQDEVLQNALIRLVEIVGEASNHVDTAV